MKKPRMVDMFLFCLGAHLFIASIFPNWNKYLFTIGIVLIASTIFNPFPIEDE